MSLIIRWVISSAIVLLTAYLLPGVYIHNFGTALLVAALIALLNVFLKPLLVIFTIPITIITFGLFLLVINAIIVLLASHFISGFYVDGFWWALAFSIIMTILSSLFGLKGERERRE